MRIIQNDRSIRIASQVFLLVLLLSIVANLFDYFQTKHQLASPLIPTYTVYQIIQYHMEAALTGGIAAVFALIFYFFHKYFISLCISVLALMFQLYLTGFKPFQDSIVSSSQ